jgi:hypothetical protein
MRESMELGEDLIGKDAVAGTQVPSGILAGKGGARMLSPVGLASTDETRIKSP